jgi:hypothetical protein
MGYRCGTKTCFQKSCRQAEVEEVTGKEVVNHSHYLSTQYCVDNLDGLFYFSTKYCKAMKNPT